MAKMIDKAAKNDLTPEEDEVLDTIFTIPNLISTIRLCMVPCFIVLLLTGYDILATVLFAVAAGLDRRANRPPHAHGLEAWSTA